MGSIVRAAGSGGSSHTEIAGSFHRLFLAFTRQRTRSLTSHIPSDRRDGLQGGSEILHHYPVSRGRELGFCFEGGDVRYEKCTTKTVKQCQLLAVTGVQNTQRRNV
jgi:hypothetical protein